MSENKEITYCLETKPSQWNFCNFLVAAKTLGFDRIKFVNYHKIQIKKYINNPLKIDPKTIAINRFKNIVLPLCDLANISYFFGYAHSDDKSLGCDLGVIYKIFEEKNFIWRFNPLKEKEDYVTITIRDSIRNKFRDSHPDWRLFIKQFKNVIILEDRELNPITVMERLSLYSGAKMNYGVMGGATAILLYTTLPYKLWVGTAIKDKGTFEEIKSAGANINSNFPFSLPNQYLIWEEDNIESLIKNK